MTKKRKKKLRAGFTTGTSAAASVKAALTLLKYGKAPSHVKVRLLTGDDINIFLNTCEKKSENNAVASVIKDAGDDPDITHKAEIGALVSILDDNKSEVVIKGGKGVGKITKPGLEIPPGEPAINPGPRKMINLAVRDVLGEAPRPSVEVMVFVPKGEELAKRTLNKKLGILGGISILGTTGIVRPMSHEAYIATIKSAISIVRAMKTKTVVLTTGRRSERFAQAFLPSLPEEAFVQIGDFFKMGVRAACDAGFKKICLAVFFGKAVKMAMGIPHTHAGKSELTLFRLANWAKDFTDDDKFSLEVQKANTARHAFDIIIKKYPDFVSYVGEKVIKSAEKFAFENPEIRVVIFNFDGGMVFDSGKTI